jgi:peptide/nickel transport system ATP-binding protein
MALLEVSHLKTHFFTERGVVRAVDDVSFQVSEGEILGIVGESGSGKSITSLSLLRLIDKPGKIVSGEVFFEGRDLLKLPREQLRQVRGAGISMIFQEPASSMNPVLTVGFQISEAIRSHEPVGQQKAKTRALDLMHAVGIPDPKRRFDQYPHQFSGGMLQRLMIAMGLALSPALIIADEPVTALDVTIQAQILDLLRDLRAQTNAAILLITHDMGVIAEVCDRVLVMYLGKIVEDAPVFELFDNPKHPYTQGLLGAMPKIDVQQDWLTTIAGSVPSPLEAPAGCSFSNRCPKVMPVCHERVPPLTPTPSHRVACHLFDETGSPRE